MIDTFTILIPLFLCGLGIGYAIANRSCNKDLDGLGAQIDTLEVSLMQAKHEAASQSEKVEWLQNAEQRAKDAFASLAGQTLRASSDDLVKRSRESLEAVMREVRGDWQTQKAQLQHLVDPVKETLAALDSNVRQLEQKREGAYSSLETQLGQLGRAHAELQTSTTTLSQALKSSSVRGRWGELQLRRIVQLAGMAVHVDFDEQVSADGGRPDMVCHLPNGGILPVDAKAPMDAYLAAVEATSVQDRDALIGSHVEAVRSRIRDLSRKAYWSQFERAPECVVMFVPVESALGAAYDRDPDLFEWALSQNVMICTPVTLLALLKAVAFGWQSHQVSENARKIAEEGKELYGRLETFLKHLGGLGLAITKAVDGYNGAVASLQSRVLPAAKRMQELGVSTSEAPELKSIEAQAREVTVA